MLLQASYSVSKGDNMCFFGYTGMYGGGMMFFWLVLIALAIWLLIQVKPKGLSRTPLDIAKERYASGEITKKEFDEIKKSL